MNDKFDPNAVRLRRFRTGIVYLSAVCLFFCLSFTALPLSGQTVKSRDNTNDAKTTAQIRQKLLEPAFDMLKAKGVPFNPKLFLKNDWRSQLEPSLPLMPEMGKTVRVTEPMAGVYLADTLLLPEKILLVGDTFILTREFAPEDENTSISITGNYRLFIFNIGDSKKFAAMAKARSKSQLLDIKVAAPCGIFGIAPIYVGKLTCQGLGVLSLDLQH